jgi:hypothetical protein
MNKGYMIPVIILLFIFVATTGANGQNYEYLPGDFNMYYGEWPPKAWGNDITYLANHFKGVPDCMACALGVFWASADVNGSCSANGLDVTYLMNYFRGLNDSLIPCDQFPTSWPDSLPEDPPAGWPNCGTLSSAKQTGLLTDTRDPDVYIWIGRSNGLPLEVQIGQVVDIDVYVQTADSVFGGDLHVPLGADTQYVANLLGQTQGQLYYPLDNWDVVEFMQTYNSPPNPAGWMSQSLMGWRWIYSPTPPSYLYFSSPTKIASFAVEFVNDSSLMGQTVSCLGIGEHPSGWPLWVGDTLGINGYTVSATVSDIHFYDPTAIPTLSEWGMLILALLLLVAGTVAVVRKKRAAMGEVE